MKHSTTKTHHKQYKHRDTHPQKAVNKPQRNTTQNIAITHETHKTPEQNKDEQHSNNKQGNQQHNEIQTSQKDKHNKHTQQQRK